MNAIIMLLSRWSKFYPSGTFFSVALLLVVPCLYLMKKWRKVNMASLPPGPRGVPVLGYLPFLGPVANLHRRMAELAATHGPIYKLWLGSNLWVVVSSPSLVREMIHPDRDHIFMNRSPPISASIMAYQKSGVFTSQGPYWREMRKIFAGKMLSNANVDGCYDIRRQVVHKAIRDVYARSIGVPIDVDELLYLTVTDAVIGMVVGGGGKGAMIEGIPDKFREVLEELITLPSKLNVSDMFPALAWLDIQGIAKRAKKASSRSDQMLDALIKQRIEQGNDRQGLSKDFLHVLLELKDINDRDENATSFTMIQLKALLQDAIIGGTDAPAQSAIWVIRELMKHPKVMEKVKNELTEVVGENEIVEESHLPNLQYLDAVIKETLRLHPPIPLLVARSPKEPCIIGGYTIPEGAQVFVNAWSIHKDPLVWDSPLEFQPERFLDDSCKIDYLGNNPKYFPFGSGKRMCAGLPLARKMLPYVIASFLHALEWKLPCGVEEIDFSAKYEVLLKSKEPLIVVPTPKQHQMDLYLHSY